MERTVLIVAHHHDAPNMGAVRVKRIARRLGGLGWNVHFVASGRPAGEERCGGDAGYRLHRVPALDLQSVYRRWAGVLRRRGGGAPADAAAAGARSRDIGWTTFLNRWCMVPDKQIPWYGPAVRETLRLAEAVKPDLIFTSLDPRTNFLVAARVARETRRPLVMEYRDLWTGNPYPQLSMPTALHRALHRRMERRSVRCAARVSCVTRGMADFVTRLHAGAAWAPARVNYNFFDPDEYPAPAAPRAPDAPFRVCYMGAFYTTRDPAPFFDGLGRFLRSRGLTPSQFRFRWAGEIVGLRDLESALERNGLKNHIDFLGQIPHAEALRELRASDAALVVVAPDDLLHIPGKLFEAMGARVPALLVARPAEVTEIVERTRCGVHAPHEADAICAALGRLWDARAAGRPWEFDEPAVREFSAGAAVGRLAGLFEETIGEAATGRGSPA